MKPIRKHYHSRIVIFTYIISALLIAVTFVIVSAACVPNAADVADPTAALSLESDKEVISEFESDQISDTVFISDVTVDLVTDVDTDITVQEIWKPDPADVEAIAKTLWGECRGVTSKAQQAAVAWCILNRVDKGGYYGNSVIEVVSKPKQFTGYNPNHPVDPELAELAEDVLTRWHAEKEGWSDVGRTLPKEYCFFVGDGKLNYFTDEWKSKDYWDWSLPNPYES